MTFPAKRDPLQRDPRSFEKSSRPPHPQSKLLTLPPPSRVPSQTKSSHGYTVGIKISSATSLFSQLRNPSRKRANSTNNRAFSRPPRQRQESKRSPPPPPAAAAPLMSAAFRFLFFFLTSSAPFPFLTSHQTRCIGRIHGWIVSVASSSPPSLGIMRRTPSRG